MGYLIFLIIFVISAYALQAVLGIHQIKHFNKVYKELRSKGRVAIGTRPGRISSGTIVLFAIDDRANIIDARKMQGISVIAKFKKIDQYIGENLRTISEMHPLVEKENRLTRTAMLNARDLLIKVENGDYHEETPRSPLSNLLFSIKCRTNQVIGKLKGSA